MFSCGCISLADLHCVVIDCTMNMTYQACNGKGLTSSADIILHVLALWAHFALKCHLCVATVLSRGPCWASPAHPLQQQNMAPRASQAACQAKETVMEEADADAKEETQEVMEEADADAKAIVVLKRPAAWHSLEDNDEEQEETQCQPGTKKLKKDEQMEDGKIDERTTSRGQRYVFQKHRHLVEQDVLARFDWLADPQNRCPGKQAEINSIINSHVARMAKFKDGLQVKEMTVMKISKHINREEEDHSKHGLSYYHMIGEKFAGSEPLFQKALESGEVEFNETTKKYYLTTHNLKVSDIKECGHEGKQLFDVADAKGFLSLMSSLSDELHSEELPSHWLQLTSKALPVKAQSEAATSDDFTLMQEPSKDVKSWYVCIQIRVHGGGVCVDMCGHS